MASTDQHQQQQHDDSSKVINCSLGPWRLHVLADGTLLCGWKNGGVSVVDVTNGTVQHLVKAQNESTITAVVSRGDVVVTGSWDRTIKGRHWPVSSPSAPPLFTL